MEHGRRQRVGGRRWVVKGGQGRWSNKTFNRTTHKKRGTTSYRIRCHCRDDIRYNA